jgi:hypothetical protein
MIDRLRVCIEELRVFSMRSRNPDLVSVIERRIDEFAMGEVPEERTALERLAQVIEMFEARMRQGEDWTIAKKYVHSLLQRLAYARRSPIPSPLRCFHIAPQKFVASGPLASYAVTTPRCRTLRARLTPKPPTNTPDQEGDCTASRLKNQVRRREKAAIYSNS